mmetsp:Transcript_119904/g.255883  ORF Transcript_119904/g.255883 Transcript_119904/m.255883 type:complete len:219 (-) Transcript_119904:1000-1656(-)
MIRSLGFLSAFCILSALRIALLSCGCNEVRALHVVLIFRTSGESPKQVEKPMAVTSAMKSVNNFLSCVASSKTLASTASITMWCWNFSPTAACTALTIGAVSMPLESPWKETMRYCLPSLAPSTTTANKSPSANFTLSCTQATTIPVTSVMLWDRKLSFLSITTEFWSRFPSSFVGNTSSCVAEQGESWKVSLKTAAASCKQMTSTALYFVAMMFIVI